MKTKIKTLSTPAAFAIAAAFSALTLQAAPVFAQGAEQTDPLTKRVTYADLNLETKSGAAVFYGRLRRAAVDVCAPMESRDKLHTSAWKVCYDSALSSAVAQVNKAALTALHNESARTSRADKG